MKEFILPLVFSFTCLNFCQNVRTTGNCMTEDATPLCQRPTQYSGQLRKPLRFVSKVTRHPACHLFIHLEQQGKIQSHVT